MLALRLPLRGRGSRLSAWISTALVTGAAIAITVGANIALYRHDVHFDVSREGRNTPPAQFAAVIDHLHRPLSLTYFYNSGDGNALIARDLMAIAARGHPLFAFRAIDLDKEPGLARDVGVHAYNTAVFQVGDRRVMVENNTDVTRLAYAALRALKERVETVCFITGHGETFRPTPPHFHYSHVETLQGHDVPGAGDVLVAEPADLDRLQLALTEIGYETRGLVTASASAIPADCAVVAEIGPRTAFAAGEADLLAKYLAGGGRLLLLLDPVFPVGADLESRLLGPVGLTTPQAIVIDPLNHFRTDPDKVAVPYYPPHPITERVALTVFPQVRPIDVAAPAGGRRRKHPRRQQRRRLSPAGHVYRQRGARGGRGRRVRRAGQRRAKFGGCGHRRVAGRGSRQAFPPGARRHQQVRHQRVFSVCLERRALGRDAALARRRRNHAGRRAADLQHIRDRAHEPADARRVHRARSVAAALDADVRRTGVVEAALKRGGVVLFAPLAAGLLIVLLVVLVVSGHAPEFRGLVHFDPDGLVAAEPSADHARRNPGQAGERRVPPRPKAAGRSTARPTTAPAELAAHIDAALRFLHVSKPMRDIAAGELGRRELRRIRPRSAGERGDARRRRADDRDREFRHPQSGRHLAICPACRRRRRST